MAKLGIQYSTSWEDADLLLHALKPKEGEHILSIGASGDNVFSLLTTSPNQIIAIDSNPLQLHLIELKALAIKNLDYFEYLAFIGVKPSQNRLSVYFGLRNDLTSAARQYWNQNESQIEQGILHIGKFERYLRMFGKYILRTIHRQKTIETLIAPKSGNAQSAFYDSQWNTLAWKLLFKIFFSRAIMGNFGRKRAYLAQVNIDVGKAILERTRNHLSSTECQKNPFLEYILYGNFNDHLPHALREENYAMIQSNIDKLTLQLGQFSEIQPNQHFDIINCSDIFEYMSESTTLDHAKLIHSLLSESGRVAYWNLLVNRHLNEVLPNFLKSVELNYPDMGFFYKSFHLDIKQ